ncbi:uncharacterized protein METZ01_LOCUS34235 [marine metagenome]|uniref:Uncharacterized protein n=1 Tax=marine metagenome TaxID=408172 RepID=A0A381QPV7_9ZZZZ
MDPVGVGEGWPPDLLSGHQAPYDYSQDD